MGRDGKRSLKNSAEEKGKVATNFLEKTKRKSCGFMSQNSRKNLLPCLWVKQFLQHSTVKRAKTVLRRGVWEKRTAYSNSRVNACIAKVAAEGFLPGRYSTKTHENF